MKKIAIFAAVFVFILLLTKIANQIPPEPPDLPSGSMLSIVIGCSPTEITLVDNQQTETLLDKDSSWPDCSTFYKDDVLDVHLSRGEKTKFLSVEKTAWWRKTM